MNPIRLTAALVVIALSLTGAPRPGHAGTAATRTAKNCIFVRNNLACPCPRAEQARAVIRAARLTAGVLGSAVGTTVVAISRADRSKGAPVDSRNASQPAQPAKR